MTTPEEVQTKASHSLLPSINHEEIETEMGKGEAAAAVKNRVELTVSSSDRRFSLPKAVCTHGLFMMAPNRWDPTTQTLHRPLRLRSLSVPVAVSISQPSPSRPLLSVSVLLSNGGPLSPPDRDALLAMVRRMLRISEENDRVIREFREVCIPRAKERGFGRVFRSPTLFEDMAKCILLCNCTWPRTLSMARALCELQLEMQSHSTSEDFHPKTPQPRELKRKRGRGKKTVLNLETKLMNNKARSSEEANSVINSDHQPEHPQGHEACEIVLSDTGDFSNIIGDFPTPEELANLDPQFLAKRCGVGYRAQRIISLAKSVVDGTLQLRNLEQVCDGCASSSYEELDKQLAGVNGFGPFTRANVLMCMGFYEKIPADTETLRHLKMVHGRSCTMKSVQNDLEAVYGKYGRFQFLAYWFELWDYYETRFGDFTEMSACDYPLFTATNMRKKVSKTKA